MRQTKDQKIKSILKQVLFANIFVAIAKIVIGHFTYSASITADGFHSLTDGISNIVGLVGLSIAAKPVDKDHPYGHKKYEFLSSLFIGAMLLAIAFKIGLEAIERLLSPVTPTFEMEFFLLLLSTLIINIIVSVYEANQGKKLDSYILLADAMHTRSDVFVTIGVLITLVAIKLGAPAIIDPLASLVVMGFILHAGMKIIKTTADILVDKVAIDQKVVAAIVMSFPSVINVHSIRSRGTANQIFIDMHIILSPNMSIKTAHELVHDIEAALQQKINPHIQAIIHTEPNDK
ncbi:MAG TPA: cation transporter [Candidatus Avacidaminococcus intestinavium]|uniref:Cation transporter n=1 Tax=Candidatus Avacidaminococcus intestinavium TaxID=2840684 RepID=A0A9D1SM54_9FIRM|nr:cation transporter [Candidatus Avacidaminococcus intestinavium]